MTLVPICHRQVVLVRPTRQTLCTTKRRPLLKMKQPHFQRPSLISSKEMCVKLGMLLYNVFHYIARKLGWWQPPRQQLNGGVWSARAVQSFKIVFESMPMGSLSCRYFEHLSSSIAMRSRLQFFVSRLATVKNFGIPDFWHQLLQHIAFYRKNNNCLFD